MSQQDGSDQWTSDDVQDAVRRAIEDPSLFATLTAQFYRAEMDRVATWRTRLDQTTNWAVVVLAAILTWSFSSPDNPHYVLLIGALAIIAFLLIEAQRYQEYDAWRSRVLLIQRNLFAELYQQRDSGQSDWYERLGRDLREPSVRLPLRQALAHRLTRVYFPLLTVLLSAWFVRITIFAADAPWYRSAAVATVPGPVVVSIVGCSYLAATALVLWFMRQTTKREFGDDDASMFP